MEDFNRVKIGEIHDDREFYNAVREYTNNVWQWRAHIDDDYESEPTPDELIEMLSERIQWVKAHKTAVNRYLRKRSGPTWFRVIEGSAEKNSA